MEKHVDKASLDPDAPLGAYQAMGPSRLEHSVLGIINIFVSVITFGVLLLLNGLNGREAGPFHNNIGNLSDYYYFEVTPAGFSFAIWGFIYLMQLGFLVYAVASIFRTTSKGPLYVYPPVVPAAAFLIYTANLLSTIGWLFAFDRMCLLLATFLLLVNPLTLIACMVISLSKISQLVAFFKSEKQKYELVLLYVFVYNAWALYLGWTICASLLNFGMSLIYVGGFGQQCTGLIVLSILMLLVLVVFPLEVTVLDKYLRFVVLHWVGPINAMVGSVIKGGANDRGIKPSGVNRLYAAVILGALIICFMVKILNIFVKLWKSRQQKRHSVTSA